MGTIRGLDCKVYVNTGVYATPTWVEVEAVVTASIEAEHSAFDATRRGSGGFREEGVAVTALRFPMTLIKDKDDTGFSALETAHATKADVDLLVLDGSRTVAASDGWRAVCKCQSWNESQDLEDAVRVDAVFAPAPSANPPATATGTP